MSIRDIMSQPAVTCQPIDSLNTAAQLMWEHDCGALPVIDDDGHVVGMITDRDICMAAYTQGGTLRDVPVAQAMAKEVFSCQAEDALADVEQLMSEKQIRRVPVVNGDSRPLGVVSLNDIARFAASARRRNGIDREVIETLAAISRPRPHELKVLPHAAIGEASSRAPTTRPRAR